MKLDLTQAITENELNAQREKTLKAFDVLMNREGAGNDFLGWVDLPVDYDKEEFVRIQKAAERIRAERDALVVIGIGGSYLGARAVIEALSPTYDRKGTEVFFAGNHISAKETAELLDHLQGKKFAINVISKSGTTTEPAIAFRYFRALLEKQEGVEEARKWIFATTDRKRGALKKLADDEGYEEFVVPDDVGGRFTVLTAVGLLPIAAAGIDIEALMQGAQEMREVALKRDFEQNPSMQYAATRLAMIEKKKTIEIFVAYEPKLHYMQEWWKQLVGESEGKNELALFPAAVGNTTDLHSIGQWIQQGPHNHFELVLWIDHEDVDLTVPGDALNLDGLNYLEGKQVHYVNEQAMKGTMAAHVDGGVPNVLLHLSDLSAYDLGSLIYFFEVTIGITGYGIEVNPFDQPGVEFYKANMFKLLGKPGYKN